MRDLQNVTIMLDGGHTRASLQESADWWLEHVKSERTASASFLEPYCNELKINWLITNFLSIVYVASLADAVRILVFNCRQNKPAPALLTPVVTAITDAGLPYSAAYFVASKVLLPDISFPNLLLMCSGRYASLAIIPTILQTSWTMM